MSEFRVWPIAAQEMIAERTMDHWDTLRAISPGCGGVITEVAQKVREQVTIMRDRMVKLEAVVKLESKRMCMISRAVPVSRAQWCGSKKCPTCAARRLLET